MIVLNVIDISYRSMPNFQAFLPIIWQPAMSNKVMIASFEGLDYTTNILSHTKQYQEGNNFFVDTCHPNLTFFYHCTARYCWGLFAVNEYWFINHVFFCADFLLLLHFSYFATRDFCDYLVLIIRLLILHLDRQILQ